MKDLNLRLSAYAIVVLLIFILSMFLTSIPEGNVFFQIYDRLLFAVPVLFIIAAFLAFRIAESGIAVISLTFLVMPFSEMLTGVFAIPSLPVELLGRFFMIYPFMTAFTLSFMYLLPDKAAGRSMISLRLVLAVLPLVYFFVPELIENILLPGNYNGISQTPWPGLAAALLPMFSVLIYKTRRARSFSPALTASLILVMLPVVLSLNNFLQETCYLFAGIIILHSIYRVYWENSYIDELTGLFNRRALDEKMRRLGGRYSLSMADIDHFKNFNDTYGHDEGDNVLRLVAKILYSHFGTTAYRYGGEEFCIVFRKTDVKEAAAEMNEAREDIAGHGFIIRKSQKNRKKSGRKTALKSTRKVKLTISAGIAESGMSRLAAPTVLKNADKALYKAKKNGRNRVEVYRGQS